MNPDAARWLAKAEEDLQDAQVLLANSRWAAAAFFAQQTGEVALKAVSIERTGKTLRTHSLIVLAEELKAPAEILARARRLTPAYTAQRYPDVAEAISEAKARLLVTDAQEVLAWARRQLS